MNTLFFSKSARSETGFKSVRSKLKSISSQNLIPLVSIKPESKPAGKSSILSTVNSPNIPGRLCGQYANFLPNIHHISAQIMPGQDLSMIPCLIQVLSNFNT